MTNYNENDDYFSQKYDNKNNNNISIFQKLLIGIFLIIFLFIIIFQLAPKNQKERIYNLFQAVRFEIIWVNFNKNDSIKDIFSKNCPYLSWQDYCKNIIVNNYFYDIENELLYEYCKSDSEKNKIYCLWKEKIFEKIEKSKVFFMEDIKNYKEDDKSIIREISDLLQE